MEKKKDTKQEILKAATKEFASKGYGSARMNNIAKRAKINKAMLFYYFTSKHNLYQTVVKQAFSKIFPQVVPFLKTPVTPAQFIEEFTRIHYQFLEKNQDLIKIISFDLLHNRKNISEVIPEIIKGMPVHIPELMNNLLKKWYSEGQITEKDPMNFMLNILSLNIFSFIGRPVFEKVFEGQSPSDELYSQKRLNSIINLLKKGMLK